MTLYAHTDGSKGGLACQRLEDHLSAVSERARRNVSGGVSGDSRAGDEGGRSPSEDQAL